MTKKLSVLSRHVKPIEKSGKNTRKLSTKLRNELQNLVEVSDAKINYTDIPELDLERLENPIIGKFYRPIKKPISIRLDADVLQWFKAQPEKYQQLINKVCRSYYLRHKNETNQTQTAR